MNINHQKKKNRADRISVLNKYHKNEIMEGETIL